MDVRSVERFISKIQIDLATGCWKWTAATDRDGYGFFQLKRRRQQAHRVSFAHFVGAIPSGLVIDHLCRVRNCVNPGHLEPKSSRANTFAPGSVAPSALNAAKAHCPRGHQLTEPNLSPSETRKGMRTCLACQRAHSRVTWRKLELTDVQFKALADEYHAVIMAAPAGETMRGVKCPRGHWLESPNLVPSSLHRGKSCLACKRACSLVNNRRARRGEELDLKTVSDRYYAEIMAEAEVANG